MLVGTCFCLGPGVLCCFEVLYPYMSFGVPAWLSFVALFSWFLASEFIIIIFLYSDSCFDLSF